MASNYEFESDHDDGSEPELGDTTSSASDTDSKSDEEAPSPKKGDLILQ